MQLRYGVYRKPSRDAVWHIRQDRIKREGSEYFTWVVPVTAPAAISSIEIAHQFPRAKKYEPLDWCEVCNNGALDLTLIINNREQLPVPTGTIRTVSGKCHLWTIGIRNDDAANDTVLNTIIVSLRREPMTADKYYQERA